MPMCGHPYRTKRLCVTPHEVLTLLFRIEDVSGGAPSRQGTVHILDPAVEFGKRIDLGEADVHKEATPRGDDRNLQDEPGEPQFSHPNAAHTLAR